MRGRVGVVAVMMLALCGCGKKPPTGAKDMRPDKVTYVADDDPRMNAAIEKDRATVDTFIAALKAPKASQSAFSIKMAFTEGVNTEHMWLTPVTYDGTNFQGTINNEAAKVKNVKMGQKVSAAPSKISDWMYIDNRKLVGGYTLRVLRDALTPAERTDFDRSVPFVIE